MNNWHFEVKNFIDDNNWHLVSQWYENALESQPEEISYYWYLGLSYLLQQQVETAHNIWLSVLMQFDELEIERYQQDLVNILTQESLNQEKKENFFLAYLICYYIQELDTKLLENNLRTIYLKQKYQQSLFRYENVIVATIIKPSILSLDLINYIQTQEEDSLPEYYNRTNLDLLDTMNPNLKTILEIGCGAGSLGERYKRINPHCEYIGLELNEEAAKIAEQRLDKVIRGNAETITDLNIPNQSIDCLVYGDVLEHLVLPEEVIKKHLSLLTENGQMIACIPNIGHWTILAKLFLGQWRYEEEGLLDKTHLRFFTLESIKKLYQDCGINIIKIKSRLISPTPENFLKASQPLLQMLNRDLDSFQLETSSFQYIIGGQKCSPHFQSLLIHTRVSQTICCKMRMEYPQQMINTIPGVTILEESQDDFHPQEDFKGLKVFIWQRPFLDYDLNLNEAIAQQKALIQSGYVTILELDDDPLHWSKEIQDDFFAFLKTCHAVQTSTDALQKELSQFHPWVKVFANHIPFLPPVKKFPNHDSVSIFFGAQNREQDWLPILPYLNQVLVDYPDKITVKVVYDELFFQSIATNNKTFQPWTDYYHYLQILSSCDLALLPLADNRFNSMKSDLKFLESSACTVASLASDNVYGNTIREGETGLIYHSPEEFKDKLVELITKRELRHKLAANAYDWVKTNRLLSQHYQLRYQWYLEISNNLLAINQNLSQRCPELFS